MFSRVHDIPTATIKLSSSFKLYPNFFSRAPVVAFLVDRLVGLRIVDFLVDLSIFSSDWHCCCLAAGFFQLYHLLCFQIRWGAANLMVYFFSLIIL